MTRLPLFLAMFLLLPAACATTDNAASPTVAGSVPTHDDSRFVLGLGQSVALSDGSQLSYTSLINDSRCPQDVQCVWAGDAEIVLRFKPARGTAHDMRLHTSQQGGATRTSIGQRTLTLVGLARGIAPAATLTITATP